MEHLLFFAPYIYLSVVGIITLMIFLKKAVYLVRQAEVVIIERLGRYDRTLGPGLHVVMPFVERPRGAILELFALRRR